MSIKKVVAIFAKKFFLQSRFVVATVASRSFHQSIRVSGMAAESLRAVSRRIELLQRRKKRFNEEADRVVVSKSLTWQVLSVYVYSGNDLDTAAAFLKRKLSQAFDMEEVRSLVVSLYRRAPTASIADLCFDESVACHGVQRLVTACRYVVESRLHDWLLNQNCRRGVAPSRTQMMRFALSALPQEPPTEVQVCARRPLCGSCRTQRKWLCSFRKRWGAKLGRLKTVAPMPLHEKQEKAGASFKNLFFLWHWQTPFWSPILGLQNGALLLR